MLDTASHDVSPSPPSEPLGMSRDHRPFHGWWVAAAAFAATFGSVAFFNPILGVFAQPLQQAFGWSRSEIALGLSLGGMGGAAIAPFAGAAIDRWGGRWVIAIAASGMAICALLLSRMETLWQFLVFYTIARALSVGAMSPAGFISVANWFERRRSFVAGVVAVGPRLGMATFPLLITMVIGAAGDWRNGWIALALIAVTSGIPALIFIRRRPEDMGLLPDGDTSSDRTARAANSAVVIDFSLREAVHTRAYWLIGFSLGFLSFAAGAINFHQIPHLVDRGLSPITAALVVTVFSSTGALGGIVGGAVASRWTIRWTMVPCLLAMAGGILLLAGAHDVESAMAYAVCYGFFFGVVVSLMQVVYADYFGRQQLGVITGSFQPVQLAMNAAGPLIAGIWYDRTGSYTGSFFLFSLLFLLAALALVFAPYPPRPETLAVRDQVA